LSGRRIEEAVAANRIAPELRQELEAVAVSRGCELVHVEFAGGILRIFLDRPGGVRLEDCEAVSRDASALLDVADFGNGRYTLEVSSPGLDRQLYGPRDYERFTGRKVRVRYLDPTTGRRATVVARLSGFRPDERGGSIELAGEGAVEAMTVRLEDVQLARLEIEL
jgi:ribosome maturation factor RimP